MLDIINAINEYECEWPDLTGMKGILLNPASGNYSDWTKPTFSDMDTENWVLCCVEEQFHLCMDMLTGDPLELVKWKEGLNAKPVTSPTFTSGQEVFIAQINTLCGIASKRYFIKEFWCDSGHL